MSRVKLTLPGPALDAEVADEQVAKSQIAMPQTVADFSCLTDDANRRIGTMGPQGSDVDRL